MFDGVYFIRQVPGFTLARPLMALYTPVDADGRFFANTGREVRGYLLSLSDVSLDGAGDSPQEAEKDLCAKIAQRYDECPILQKLLTRTDNGKGG